MRPDLFLYKTINWAYRSLRRAIDPVYTRWLFSAHGVHFGAGLYSRGIPFLYLAKGGRFTIGSQFRLNNGRFHNMAGREQNCMFAVEPGAHLSIGNNVAISSFAVVCVERIIIGNNVRIGGNTCIYDSDFHSLRHQDRSAIPEVEVNIMTKPVVIEDDCFIGGHCTILKGVRIGARSIVGLGSVVTKNIPPDEIWGGNPARFIRRIDDEFLTRYTTQAAPSTNSVSANA